jgi:hypothetical protein
MIASEFGSTATGVASLERPELLAGLDPEALDERLARRTIGRERVSLPAGAVERQHQLPAEPLAVRMLGDERLQLGDELAVPAEREVGVDSLLEHGQALLLESAGRRRREGLAVEVGQRRATPEGERIARPSVGPQPGELVEVGVPRRDVEHVSGGAGAERGAAFPQRLAQTGDVDLQRRASGLGRIVAPELVD